MRELLGRALHHIAQVLESAEAAEERILRVLELLRSIVPYEQCAMFQARPGRAPRLVFAPPTPPDRQAALSETLIHLYGRLVNERVHPLEARAAEWEAHLAVPMVGNDEAIGVLFVSGAAGGYTEQHVRELSIVSAQLAGYLLMADRAHALDEARRDAEAANRVKGEFLALVSHQLKVPLTSSLAWAQALAFEDMGPSDRTRAAKAIERNIQVQTKLIDEILELACVVTAGLRLELEAVDPGRLVEAAVAEQRLQAERRAVRLETALDESVKQLVVDPARIVQVISSLLAKAIHFTPSGGRVGVRLERTDAHVRIQVIDDGTGFPPEVLPHVFEQAVDVAAMARLAGIQPEVMRLVLESFRVGRDPLTRAYGELGVGLAVVKTLVEAHGGRLCAESLGEENGSTFTVELPLPAEAGSPAAMSS